MSHWRQLSIRIIPALLLSAVFGCGSNPSPGAADSGTTVDAGSTDAGVEISCTDHHQNGTETDTDCGGTTCAKCGAEKSCLGSDDCESGVCTDSKCVLASCTDAVKNGTETDTDCGGTCPACEDNEACVGDADCTSHKCDLTTHTCAMASCTDAVKNGDETDKDCGGSCPTKCDEQKSCGGDEDCVSGVCKTNVCQAAACDDGVKNGSEGDKDCGGTCATKCEAGRSCGEAADCASGVCELGMHLCQPAKCDDTVQNGDESDVDCGGSCTTKCDDESACREDGDCTSGVCDALKCVAASCTDDVKNGSESDKDCGGTCGGCATGQACSIGDDCASGVCPSGVCLAPACDDTVRNGNETDTDCGGGACNPCDTDQRCVTGTDCASQLCTTTGTNDKCLAARCDDTVKNGDEGGVDCGGSCTKKCEDNSACTVNEDCASGVCTGNICQMPACDDHVKNGTEADTDCGGPCPTTCTVNQACIVNEDCDQLVCTQNVCQAATCHDVTQNGDETDTDCGGSGPDACQTCADHLHCRVGADCASQVCDPVDLTCTPPACDDAVQNGDETGLNCGGSTCGPCADGLGCSVSTDCTSGVCDTTAHTCSVPSCTDTVQNGDETGLNCGGSTCGPCADGLGCSVSADCTSGVCDTTAHTCTPAACDDHVQNGTETGVDCGGSCTACVDFSSLAVQCTFSTGSGGTVDCGTTTSAYHQTGSDNYTLLGGQNTQVVLSATGVSYDAGTGALSFSASLQNLLSRTIGTIDGTDDDPAHVRLILASSTVTGGTGTITAASPDGTVTVFNGDQPYFKIDQVIAPNEISSAKTVQLNVPSTVSTFTAYFLVLAKVQAKLVINEVGVNPGGTITDANGEWFELYNAGLFPVNLAGFRIGDSSASGDRPLHLIAPPAGTDLFVQPDGYFVFGNTTNTTNNGGVTVNYAYGAAMALANSLDAVRLVSPDGFITDPALDPSFSAVCFANNDTADCTQGQFVEMQRVHYATASTSAQNGISRELKNPELSNREMDGSNWADALVTAVYGPGGRGTPGAQNSTYTP